MYAWIYYVVLNFIIEVICVLACTVGGDFQLINSTAVFRAGSVEATVLVSGTVDSIKECEESFQISASLTSSSTNLGVTIGNGTADVVVQDETEGWYFAVTSQVTFRVSAACVLVHGTCAGKPH